MNRFKQLKEEEKKKLSKAAAIDVEISEPVSDSVGESEEESKPKVNFCI